jgi:hypothetical protein
MTLVLERKKFKEREGQGSFGEKHRSVQKYVRMRRAETDAEIRSSLNFFGEFDPGSGRTLAACLIHASRANGRELAL